MKKLIIFLMLFCSANIVFAKGDNTAMIEDGKTVKINYTLTVDGKVVDTSEGKEPLEYVQGQNMIIPGLEKQLAGMKAGDKKTITVTSEEAYGPVNPQAIVEVPKSNLGEGIEPEKGMMLQMMTQDGQQLPGIIQEVKDNTLVIDFNHPLAGKDLTFDVEVVEVK